VFIGELQGPLKRYTCYLGLRTTQGAAEKRAIVKPTIIN